MTLSRSRLNPATWLTALERSSTCEKCFNRLSVPHIASVPSVIQLQVPLNVHLSRSLFNFALDEEMEGIAHQLGEDLFASLTLNLLNGFRSRSLLPLILDRMFKLACELEVVGINPRRLGSFPSCDALREYTATSNSSCIDGGCLGARLHTALRQYTSDEHQPSI